MKKTVLTILATLITLSPKTFADKRDLKTLNTLIAIGAQGESFMSQFHVTVTEVECAYSHQSRSYDCSMNDISANDGEGGPLYATGKNAEKMFKLLIKAGARSVNHLGGITVSAESIGCSQAAEGVADGDSVERTNCSFGITE